MNGCRPGFTLLEVLVAALLLGLLSSLLTTLFNQGVIAWNVGASSLSETDRFRRAFSDEARLAAALLPVTDDSGRAFAVRLRSAWDENGAVRTGRAFDLTDSADVLSETGVRTVALMADGKSENDGLVQVVVSSAGPDGRWGTEDDLSTAPLEGFE